MKEIVVNNFSRMDHELLLVTFEDQKETFNLEYMLYVNDEKETYELLCIFNARYGTQDTMTRFSYESEEEARKVYDDIVLYWKFFENWWKSDNN